MQYVPPSLSTSRVPPIEPEEREPTVTASGWPTTLPKPIAGTPVTATDGYWATEDAVAAIRAGDLAEAAIWIERLLPRLAEAGLARLVAAKTGGA